VNAIGNYDGVRPLNFLTAAPPVARLEIQADGPWSFEITPAEQAPVVPVPGHVDGNGDFVGLLSGADTAHFVYSGDRNFIVHTYGNTQELVANEIGPYDGEVLIPNDTTIIEVQGQVPGQPTSRAEEPLGLVSNLADPARRSSPHLCPAPPLHA